MPHIVLIALAVLIGLLLASMVRKKKESTDGNRRDSDFSTSGGKSTGNHQKTKPCPLCAAPLSTGERVKSKLITLEHSGKYAAPVKESISHVLGCPYCYPSNTDYPRLCPVCKAVLGSTDYVIGRYFEKEGRKDHLHVLGCTICRPSGKVPNSTVQPLNHTKP